MQLSVNVPAKVIANMMCSAIESGDPVTTASKGGWCNGIYWKTKSARPPAGAWYYDKPEIYESYDTRLEIHEVADENKWKPGGGDAENVKRGALKIHTIARQDIERGLSVMAAKFPEWFAMVLQDNTDAPCADVFLQCVLFGDEKYA